MHVIALKTISKTNKVTKPKRDTFFDWLTKGDGANFLLIG
jgi:hypothetical protein